MAASSASLVVESSGDECLLQAILRFEANIKRRRDFLIKVETAIGHWRRGADANKVVEKICQLAFEEAAADPVPDSALPLSQSD